MLNKSQSLIPKACVLCTGACGCSWRIYATGLPPASRRLHKCELTHRVPSDTQNAIKRSKIVTWKSSLVLVKNPKSNKKAFGLLDFTGEFQRCIMHIDIYCKRVKKFKVCHSSHNWERAPAFRPFCWRPVPENSTGPTLNDCGLDFIGNGRCGRPRIKSSLSV